jgi:hypothetical protein
MLVSKEGNLITLINVFETTPEQQQALIDQWTCFTEEIKDEPGVIGIALHKSTDVRFVGIRGILCIDMLQFVDGTLSFTDHF